MRRAAGGRGAAGRRRPGWPGRGGFTLAEVLVALVLLGIGGTLAVRLLTRAAREIEGAELGLRAALLLAEAEPGGGSRALGRGRFVVEVGPGGATARYEPAPGSAVPPSPIPGSGGFREARTWRLAAE